MYRIGELARRTGTSADLLRVWERRYGLLRPGRTPGGFRVYTDEDAGRVQRMLRGLDQGLAAAEAAEAALVDAPGAEPDLLAALLAFDEEQAQAVLDDALARLSLEAVLQRLVVPTLRALGDGWERGEVSVGQEHFGANLIRSRLLALARRWDHGLGPRALLACAPGDQHDLPLIVFGLALRSRGWRVFFLGTDTPIDVAAAAAAAARPDIVVLSSSQLRPELADAPLEQISSVAPLVLAGQWPAAPPGVRLLTGDPVELAAALDPA